jgi:hypothetical protein
MAEIGIKKALNRVAFAMDAVVGSGTERQGRDHCDVYVLACISSDQAWPVSGAERTRNTPKNAGLFGVSGRF